MKSRAYLAFDLGASSGRAVLGRFDGHRIDTTEVHRFPTPLVEDGERLFWDLEAVWDELQKGLRLARSIAPDLRSLSVASWGVDYVPLGSDMQPLRRAHCYRDPRTDGMIEYAEARIDADEFYGITGITPLSINTLCQVLADQVHTHDLFERTACRLLVADYFNYRFSRCAVAEVSLASTTQLYAPKRKGWASDAMRRLEIAEASWPDIVPSGTRLGPVITHESVETVAGCSHDTAAAVAAVPASDDAFWGYISSGTWSLLGVELDHPIMTKAARAVGFTNEIGFGGTVRFLKNLIGLWVLQECEREWKNEGQEIDYATLLREADEAPDVQGFIDLDDRPFTLRGNMLEKIRTWCGANGVDIPRSRGATVRLILKSLAEKYRQSVRLLEGVLGRSIEVLHVVGGGSKNALLCQWTADRCGCPVVAGPAEATALGNLLVQVHAMDDMPPGMSIRDVVRQSCELHRFEPR